jgi:hypothetical protein
MSNSAVLEVPTLTRSRLGENDIEVGRLGHWPSEKNRLMQDKVGQAELEQHSGFTAQFARTEEKST